MRLPEGHPRAPRPRLDLGDRLRPPAHEVPASVHVMCSLVERTPVHRPLHPPTPRLSRPASSVAQTDPPRRTTGNRTATAPTAPRWRPHLRGNASLLSHAELDDG